MMQDSHDLSALFYKKIALLYYIPYNYLDDNSQMDVDIFCGLAIKSHATTINSKT